MAAGPPAYDVDALLEGLADPSWPRKAEALRSATAGLTGGQLDREAEARLAPALVAAAHDAKWEVRKAAALALAELRDRGDAAQRTLDELAGDSNRWVSQAAARAIRHLRSRSERAREWALTEETADPILAIIVARIREIGLRSMTPARIYDLAMQIAEHSYRELAADTAHEIRTLLTPLEGYLAELGRHLGARKVADATSERYLANTLERLQQLKLLVDDLHVYSSPGGLDFAPVDLAAVVCDAVALGSEGAGADGRIVRQEIDVPPGMIIDALTQRLVRAVANLVANAWQAMPEGGTLSVRARRAGDDRVELVVADTGHGMSAEALAHARERFRSTRRDQGGTGLGLPIVERIVVHDHGGELAITSTPGEGTTVTLLLPVTRP
jgi:signal transduction histidine kinase